MEERIMFKLIKRYVRTAFNSVSKSSQLRTFYIDCVSRAILKGEVDEGLREDVEYFIDQQKECVISSKYRFYAPSIEASKRKDFSDLIKRRLSKEQGLAFTMFIAWIEDKKREIKGEFLKNGKFYNKDNCSF